MLGTASCASSILLKSFLLSESDETALHVQAADEASATSEGSQARQQAKTAKSLAAGALVQAALNAMAVVSPGKEIPISSGFLAPASPLAAIIAVQVRTADLLLMQSWSCLHPGVTSYSMRACCHADHGKKRVAHCIEKEMSLFRATVVMGQYFDPHISTDSAAGGLQEACKSAHRIPLALGARRAGAHCPQRGSSGHRAGHPPCNLRAKLALKCLHSWRDQRIECQGSPQKVYLTPKAVCEDDVTPDAANSLCQDHACGSCNHT